VKMMFRYFYLIFITSIPLCIKEINSNTINDWLQSKPSYTGIIIVIIDIGNVYQQYEYAHFISKDMNFNEVITL
jgi:hypothetical protein